MCVALPARVLDIVGEGVAAVATVEAAGSRREVSLVFLPDARPGDFVTVHSGYAVARQSAEEAKRALALLSRATD